MGVDLHSANARPVWLRRTDGIQFSPLRDELDCQNVGSFARAAQSPNNRVQRNNPWPGLPLHRDGIPSVGLASYRRPLSQWNAGRLHLVARGVPYHDDDNILSTVSSNV